MFLLSQVLCVREMVPADTQNPQERVWQTAQFLLLPALPHALVIMDSADRTVPWTETLWGKSLDGRYVSILLTANQRLCKRLYLSAIDQSLVANAWKFVAPTHSHPVLPSIPLCHFGLGYLSVSLSSLFVFLVHQIYSQSILSLPSPVVSMLW